MDLSGVSEVAFLSSYRMEDYERPSVTTDIAVFALQTQQEGLYRKDPRQELSVLLIRRGVHPFRGQWALPGGFLRPDETVEGCALRELQEETGLLPVSMLPVDVFSEPDRDPRGRIVSFAYASVVTEEKAKVVGGDDALEAQWFHVRSQLGEDGSLSLSLTYQDICLRAVLREERTLCGGRRFRIVSNEGLAFDHAAIIAGAMAVLKGAAERLDILFDLLPETFTLTALQRVQETLMGISQLPANFRRKVADLVEETDGFTEGAGHRPARLYRRKGRR